MLGKFLTFLVSIFALVGVCFGNTSAQEGDVINGMGPIGEEITSIDYDQSWEANRSAFLGTLKAGELVKGRDLLYLVHNDFSMYFVDEMASDYIAVYAAEAMATYPKIGIEAAMGLKVLSNTQSYYDYFGVEDRTDICKELVLLLDDTGELESLDCYKALSILVMRATSCGEDPFAICSAIDPALKSKDYLRSKIYSMGVILLGQTFHTKIRHLLFKELNEYSYRYLDEYLFLVAGVSYPEEKKIWAEINRFGSCDQKFILPYAFVEARQVPKEVTKYQEFCDATGPLPSEYVQQAKQNDMQRGVLKFCEDKGELTYDCIKSASSRSVARLKCIAPQWVRKEEFYQSEFYLSCISSAAVGKF